MEYYKQVRENLKKERLQIYKNNIIKYNHDTNVIKNMLTCACITDMEYKSMTSCYDALIQWLKK